MCGVPSQKPPVRKPACVTHVLTMATKDQHGTMWCKRNACPQTGHCLNWKIARTVQSSQMDASIYIKATRPDTQPKSLSEMWLVASQRSLRSTPHLNPASAWRCSR